MKFEPTNFGGIFYSTKSSIHKLVRKVLVIGLMSTSIAMIATPSANAATPVGTTNDSVATAALLNENTAIANLIAESGTATLMYAAGATQSARSVGLVSKSTTLATGQTATVIPGAVLSLYAHVSTKTAFSADGGTFSASAVSVATVTGTFSTGSTAIAFALTADGATPAGYNIAALWTAPSTAGTYIITTKRALSSTADAPTSVNPLLGVTTASITVTVAARSHSAVGGTNDNAMEGVVNNNMFVAIAENTGASAVVHPDGNLGIGEATAKSKGILSKNTNITTAQTATVLTSGVLSLYSFVSTHAAYTASAGTFSGSLPSATAEFSNDRKTTWISGATSSARKTISTLWTAPSSAGTYTISLYTGYPTNSSGLMIEPTASAGLLPATLGAALVVTVVAASAGGAYSAVYSGCTTDTDSTYTNASGLDAISSSDVVTDGNQWFVNFALRDAYNAALGSGNLVATATNGALINIGTSGATPAAGTSSTDVEFATGSANTIRVDQPTSGAPLTTTVTLTYNGTTVCTKTVTIRGTVAKITVANVGTQDLSGTAGGEQWMYQSVGAYYPGQFTVLATDSAGNIVATPSSHGTYAMVSSTATTTVPAMTFPTGGLASSTSSSAVARFTYGAFTCGAAAGSSSVKVQYTIAATGTIITSDAFTARCADDPYTYTASLDKASYTQGDIATLTVKFLDSKGNAANNSNGSSAAVGANRFILPFMTGVDIASSLGVDAASTTAVTKADGTITYTLTVGSASSVAVTAGTYTGIVEYTKAALATSPKSTPTYKLGTGSTDISFTEVLKSVVALIASINKQIQALQKLILKR